MDTATIGDTVYDIYTQDEADAKNLRYTYWKDLTSLDQWALTDDHYVMYVRKLQTYNGTELVTLGGAVKWVSENNELHWENYRKTGNFTSTNPYSNWVDREAGTRRVQRAIDVMVASFMETGRYDWKRAGQVYRPDQEIPEATLKRLFHKKKIRTMLRDKLKELYKEKGFTEEWVVDNIMEAAKTAAENGDPLNQLRATEKGIELLQMKPGTITETTERSVETSQNVLEDVKQYQARLSERKTLQQPQNSPSIEQRPDDESE